LLRRNLTEAQLLAYINRVRQAIPSHIPVTTADVYGEWLAHPALINAVAIVLPNYYPYWEGVRLDKAIARLHCWHQRLLAAANGKPVIVSETGWPSCGNTFGCAAPSPENASFYFLNFISWARANEIEYFYFSAFDEGWKAAREGPQGACWGVWDKHGNLKPGMQRVFDGDTIPANWNTGEMPGGPGTPAIEFTCTPPYRSFEDLQGQVWHVNTDSFKVAVFIYIAELNGWWNKPTFMQKLTGVNCDGSWTADVTTGGVDERATMLVAFLVPNGYVPPTVNRAQELPVELDSVAVAWAAVTRVPNTSNWKLFKKAGALDIAHEAGTKYRRHATLDLRESHFRMKPEFDSGRAASALLLPSFWEDDSLRRGAPITAIAKHEGADLLITIGGNISRLQARGQIRLASPQSDSLLATVTMHVTGNLQLDRRPNEAFKPLVLSAAQISSERRRASAAHVGSRRFPLPASGWIIQTPEIGSIFGLLEGTLTSSALAYTLEARMTGPRPITGWVAPVQNSQSVDVELWAASDSVINAWQYTLVAKYSKKAPPELQKVYKVYIEEASLPREYQLEQNYPNPFNPSTVIRYALPKSGFVTLKVYDLLGNEIASLVREPKPAGEYEVQWHSAGAPSGVYVYRLQVGDFVETKKLVLVR